MSSVRWREGVAHTLPLLRRYSVAAALSGLAFLAAWLLLPVTTPLLSPAFIAAVLLSAWSGGRGPMLLAVLLSTVGVVYLLPPVGQLAVASPSDLVRVGVFVAVALLVGGLTAEMGRLLQRAAQARGTAEALADLVRQGAAAPDPQQVIGLITQQACALLGADFAVIGVLDPEGTTSWQGRWGTRTAGWDERAPRLRAGVGITGRVLAEQRTVVIARLGATPDTQGEGYRLSLSEGGRTMLGTAIVERAEALGVLLVGWRTEVDLPAPQVRLAETLASHAATILANARTRVALAASERRYRTLYEAVACGVLVQDASGAILHANGVAQEVLGLPLDQMEGRAPETLWTATTEDGTPLADADRPRQVVLRTGKPVHKYLLGVRRPDGDERWLLLDSVPLLGPAGTAPQVVSTFIDITERKRAEAAHAQLAEEHAARAAAEAAVRIRDELLAAAAHDLRTPLTGIKGLTQVLEHLMRADRGPQADTRRASLARINTTVDRMTRLIDGLIDIARVQMGEALPLQRRPTDLVALAQQVAAEHQALSPRHQVRVEAPPAPVVGDWDAARLARALSNLVSNAVKYSPQGGEIRLTVRPSGNPDGDEAVLSVQDPGLGIPAADLPQIFERFHRGSNVQDRIEGTGIGLATVRHIIAQHGGTVAIQSAEGAGTTVTVRLPLGPAPVPPAFQV